MPSPFPGMDPFLEHPAYFPSLHTRLIVEIANTLQAVLPEPYYAEVDERLWVTASRRTIEPDVDVIYGSSKRRRASGGAAATLSVRSKPLIITVPNDEHRERFVEIRTRLGSRERVVAHLEVLSISNKTRGDKGQKLYLRKQQEVLDDGGVHLIEIDLLRAGQHVTAIPKDLLHVKASPFDYHVCVRPCEPPAKIQVYAIDLSEPLPEIAVPLLPEDPAVPLDLQAVFNRCYDAGPYRRRVRYALNRLKPALPPKKLAWVKQVLRAKRS